MNKRIIITIILGILLIVPSITAFISFDPFLDDENRVIEIVTTHDISGSFPNSHGLASNGTSIWISDINSDFSYRYNMNTWAWEKTINPAWWTNPWGIAQNGTHVVFTNPTGNYLYQFTYAGVSTKNVSVTTDCTSTDDASIIAFDGTNYYLADYGDTYIRVYNSALTYVSCTDRGIYGNPQGLDYDGSHFWGVYGTNLKQFDWGGTLYETIDLTDLGYGGAVGLYTDGTNFWITDATDETLVHWKRSYRVLNLTFSEATNITLIGSEGGEDYVNNVSIQENIADLGEGEILVQFGNSQLYSTNLNYMNDTYENLSVIDTDLVQKIKVVASGTGINDVLVKVYKQISGSNQLVYSAYTDGNGQAIVNVDDGNVYTITAEKEGYETTTELINIPASNTETILMNIVPLVSLTETTLFTSNCKNKESSATTCHFKGTAYQEIANITIVTNQSGTITTKECLTSTNCTTVSFTLNSTNTTYPIYSTLYFDGSQITNLTVTYEDLTTRTIQINFPVATIKSDPLYLSIFYFLTLVLGLFIGVSIEKKIEGWGVLGFIVWLSIIAIAGFWEYWLVIMPLMIIQIAKFYYEWIK